MSFKHSESLQASLNADSLLKEALQGAKKTVLSLSGEQTKALKEILNQYLPTTK